MDAVETEEVSTIIGGYAQIQSKWLRVGAESPFDGEASLRRLVVYVFHDFGNNFRSSAELEWENAIACDGCEGSVEAEQAYIEWGQPALSLRAGLVLVPMGIVNEWHEPPVFNGVDRPDFDQFVIPSTWRELGVGLVGRAHPLRYALYALTPLDPTRLDASGIASARGRGSLTPSDAVALSGRVEVEPTLGTLIGVSGYGSDAGPAGDWFDATGTRLDLAMPIYGADLDARGRWGPVEARGIAASWWLPESDDLMEAYRADGSPYFTEGAAAVPTRMWGAYAELGLNTLWFVDPAGAALVVFGRLETWDLNAAVPEGFSRDPALDVDIGTFGLTFRPISQVVFKADVQLRDRRYGLDELGVNAGLGWMF